MRYDNGLVCESCGKKFPEVVVETMLDPFQKEMYDVDIERDLCGECHYQIAQDV